MINLRGLIVSGTSLLGLVVTAPTAFVSAQFMQDHQHVYFDPIDYYPVSSQALTVVPPPEDEELNEYAFVAGFKPEDILERQITRPLIVKLKPNMPTDKAFDLDWSKTYYFADEIATQSAKMIHLDARDIHHVDFGDGKAGYIICGKVTKGNVLKTTSSFLLLTDLDGNSKKFMVYPGIKELNSVVPTKGDVNTQGFVTVGTAFNTKQRYDTAAYLSVDIDLSPICNSVTEGKWPNTVNSVVPTFSTFKKVIQHGQDNFAMVGHSIKNPSSCKRRDTDILVSVKNQKCSTIASFHYGQGTSSDAYNEEFGMSLAEDTPGSGKGLVITGRVKQTKLSCITIPALKYEDGFIMRLDTKLKLKYFHRFDYDTDSDIGLAIAVIRNRIWVSGETTTSFFNTTSLLPKKRDIFLLEFKKNGSLQNSFVYGGPEDDGGLSGLTPGNLDLESSQKGFPIILGNSRSTNYTQESAYLIEHYRTTKKSCRRMEKKPNLEQYAAKKRKNKDIERNTTEAKEMSLVAIDVELKEQVECKKV